MKKITQTLIAACFFAAPALAQQQELAERAQPLAASEAAQEPIRVDAKTERTEKSEKADQEMIGLLKSSGFEGEQIEGYLEVSKKIGMAITELDQNDGMKLEEKDGQKKKLMNYREEMLKKIFGDERYEKFVELERQAYGDREKK